MSSFSRFDQGSTLLAVASVDSRVKIFDAITVAPHARVSPWRNQSSWQGQAKQEFLATGHLHTRIKSIAWASPSSGKSKKHLLAVGCESGVVDVFDAVSGATVATLANSKTVQGHSASVNDACFDASGSCSCLLGHPPGPLLRPTHPFTAAGSSLFSASSDGSVIRWDVTSGSNVSKFAADK
jgi:WD40 repeat protein